MTSPYLCLVLAIALACCAGIHAQDAVPASDTGQCAAPATGAAENGPSQPGSETAVPDGAHRTDDYLQQRAAEPESTLPRPREKLSTFRQALYVGLALLILFIYNVWKVKKRIDDRRQRRRMELAARTEAKDKRLKELGVAVNKLELQRNLLARMMNDTSRLIRDQQRDHLRTRAAKDHDD
eukprot:m.93558 g.93558  ORF g.93558 m.93558 type:complete len:181 (+) comp8542_c0_seq1:415-957(+)